LHREAVRHATFLAVHGKAERARVLVTVVGQTFRSRDEKAGAAARTAGLERGMNAAAQDPRAVHKPRGFH
jgi:hypothetical protein